MIPSASASSLSPREVLSSSTTRSCVSGKRISSVLKPLMPPLWPIIGTVGLAVVELHVRTAQPNA